MFYFGIIESKEVRQSSEKLQAIYNLLLSLKEGKLFPGQNEWGVTFPQKTVNLLNKTTNNQFFLKNFKDFFHGLAKAIQIFYL